MQRSAEFRFAAIRLFALALLLAPLWVGAEETAPAATPLFQRVVLLGASATAGFEDSPPTGGEKTRPQHRFVDYVEAALTGPHEAVVMQASALLFLQAETTLEKKVTATIAAKPTLVVGFDVLFWFCYGTNLTAEQRKARFEVGLRQLERIDAPLVVGDIPDAAKAVGGMLSNAEMPDPAVLEQCNARLTVWAAGRKNVTVFPLARLMAAATTNEEFVLNGHTWEKGTSVDLLRRDHLHPSRQGLTALAIATLAAAADAANPAPSPGDLCRDFEKVSDAANARIADSAKAPK